MLKLAVLLLVGAYAYASFESGHNKYFDGKTAEQKRALLGTKLDGKHTSRDHLVVSGGSAKGMPTSFTSGKDKWQHCASTINYIKDQAACGSCWAVSASEIMADRICIACPGVCSSRLNEAQPCLDMSAEQIMACCSWCGDGCQGGYPIDAMRYWAWTGVVTGGWYGSKCGCQPYMVDPTNHNELPTPQCQNSCQPSYPVSFTQDKHYAKDHREVRGEAAMMQEIYNNGPIQCAFQVYENFMNYKSGVYDHKSGRLEGGHAIKIIGWGVDGGKKYWLINNSWNTTWGMTGQFKFLRGTNLCGMEEGCVAGDPKCNNNVDNTVKCVN